MQTGSDDVAREGRPLPAVRSPAQRAAWRTSFTYGGPEMKAWALLRPDIRTHGEEGARPVSRTTHGRSERRLQRSYLRKS